jgi:hypothetical protein
VRVMVQKVQKVHESLRDFGKSRMTRLWPVQFPSQFSAAI